MPVAQIPSPSYGSAPETKTTKTVSYGDAREKAIVLS